jgi:phosphate transport system permease protein
MTDDTRVLVDDELGPRPRPLPTTIRLGDRVFHGLARAAGLLTLVVMGLIAALLLVDGWPAIDRGGIGFFTSRQFSATGGGDIASLLFGTAVVAVIAMVLAVPIGIGTALFINLYAPSSVRRGLVLIVDLLACVPSLIFGLWGFYYLQPHLVGTTRWLNQNAAFIPIFKNGSGIRGGSMFLAGIVVAVMILPIMTAITRDVLARVPTSLTEGASALGGTRAAVIRDVMLPFGRSGIVGATLLGLGRALGETVAVSTVLAPSAVISSQLTAPGGNTISAAIALFFNNADHNGKQTLVAAGLTLFVISLVVNQLAHLVVARSSVAGAGIRL